MNQKYCRSTKGDLLNKIFRSVLTFMIGAIPLFGFAQNFYVSPNGSDANSGSIDKPFSTLERAKLAIEHRSGKQTAINIFLRKGIYVLDHSFTLTTDDSGTASANVTFSAYPGEEVIIRGSKVVDGQFIHRVTDQQILKRIKPQLRDSLVVVDLDKMQLTHINKYPDNFNDDGNLIELYFDNKRMPLSRYPNSGFMTMKKVIVNGGGQETANADWANYYGDNPPKTRPPRPGVFEYRDLRENSWVEAVKSGVWLKGFWRIPWQNEAVRVGSIDTVNHQITLAVPVAGGIGNKYTRPAGNGKEPYWLINLLEEIDVPGEWAIDFASKKLYFYPPNKISNGSLRIADFDAPLIDLDNTSYINFKRIVVEENLNSAFKISGGKCNLIAGCTVRNITKNGIVLDGGFNHEVLSNDVYNIGAAGIWLRGGDENATPKISANFKVINNHIYHFGQITRVYAPGINAGFTGGGGGGHHCAVGMYIAHNLIHDTPHVGVLFGSWNSVFEYNEVFDYCQVSDDMGAFYCYDQFDRMGGHTFAYNYIHDSPIGDGIYFDHDHRDVHIYGNIIALNSAPNRRGTAVLYKIGSMAKPGFNQTMDCHDNLAINCSYGYQFFSPVGVQNTIYNNVSVENNVDFKNYVVDSTGVQKTVTDIPFSTGKNIAYKTDPGFVNLAQHNYLLKPSALIYSNLPNFKLISLSDIGLFIDEYRTKLPTDDEISRYQSHADVAAKGTEILDRK